MFLVLGVHLVKLSKTLQLALDGAQQQAVRVFFLLRNKNTPPAERCG
jgi:hypothetical protein